MVVGSKDSWVIRRGDKAAYCRDGIIPERSTRSAYGAASSATTATITGNSSLPLIKSRGQ